MIHYDTGGSLLHDLENIHRAGLGADAAGNALGSVALRGIQHDQAERADRNALAAAVAELFVDAVNAGLLILGDGALGAGTSAFSALNAGLRSGSAFLIDDRTPYNKLRNRHARTPGKPCTPRFSSRQASSQLLSP